MCFRVDDSQEVMGDRMSQSWKKVQFIIEICDSSDLPNKP